MANPDELAEMIEAVGDALASGGLLDEQDLLAAGYLAQAIILNRTKAGLDADGQPFAPYSDGYARTRESKGLSRTPDLAFTGHMLQGFGPPRVSGPQEVTIDFQSRAEADKATWTSQGTKRGMPARDWLDIRRPQELELLAEEVGNVAAVRLENILK